MNNATQQCYSCGQILDIMESISLDLSRDLHVCSGCWRDIPVPWRALLRTIAKSDIKIIPRLPTDPGLN
jgi:hypothetical protein